MVTPSEMSEVLVAHPGVRRAEAAAVRHNGQDVTVAAVELDEYLSGPILREYVRQRLGAGNGLVGVLTVDRIPRTGGSVDVEQLRSAVTDGRCTLFEPPRDDVERRLATIWSHQMDVSAVGVHDDFLELGGDSLSALGIISAIETEFDRPLDVYEFMTAANIARLADILR
jgi:acyl carrier protein